MQYIIINLHTKYDYSSLLGFTEIFDGKLHYSNYGKKEILTNIGKKKMKRLVTIPRYNISLSTCIVNLATLACTVSQKSWMKNFIIQSMERKKIGQMLGRISMKRLVVILRYNTSLSSCKQNMITPACTVSKKSLTKNCII